MSTVKAIDTLDEIMEEIATSDETLFIVRFHHSFCIPCINTTPTFVNLSKGHHPGVVFVDAGCFLNLSICLNQPVNVNVF